MDLPNIGGIGTGGVIIYIFIRDALPRLISIFKGNNPGKITLALLKQKLEIFMKNQKEWNDKMEGKIDENDKRIDELDKKVNRRK